MPLAIGSRLGPYEIVAALGAGGMGEVYRARDARLDRDVAIKILPDSFAADPERLTRFTREAQTLAALNHTNIAHVYGLEEGPVAAGIHVRALVMELVEGEDLSQRIARGAIPIDDVLPIAKQIADALEAAHEQGIVHRDLKPANVKVRPDGTVKVLDFGLAKAMEPVGSDVTRNMTNSPTLTAAMTMQGVILGTAGYMAPEQARGRNVDKRADIWAFGVVLYELLTGRRTFEGEDVSLTLASVMMKEPDWTQLPASTPPALRRLIARCLKKDPKSRLRDIGEARLQIEEVLAGAPQEPVNTSAVVQRLPLWRRALTPMIAAGLTGAIAALAVWTMRPSERQPDIARFAFELGEEQVFTNTGRLLVAVSPDGKKIVYVANYRLWLRELADMATRPIPGAEANESQGLNSPTFSPDGQWIAFWSDNSLKRIPVSGGAASPICTTPSNVNGMSWTGDYIVFGQAQRGIMRVLATGGAPETIVTVKAGEIASSPQLLPDGDTVLFTLLGPGLGWDKAQIVGASIRSKATQPILAAGADARYLSTGHLLYAVDGDLLAVRFDAQYLKPLGSPMLVVEGVRRAVGAGQTGLAHVAVSGNGTLVYVRGPRDLPITAQAGETLARVDRQGNVASLNLPPGLYQDPRVSPDGTRVAFWRTDNEKSNVYTYDLSGTTTMQPLTYEGNNRYPTWSADSRHLAFQSDREHDLAVFWQLADGTGKAERLTTAASDEFHVPESFSRSPVTLLYSIGKKIPAGVAPTPRPASDASSAALTSSRPPPDVSESWSLWMLSLPQKKNEPFGDVHSYTPIGAVFSPNGEWVAYSTGEQFNTTIYVRPFPPTAEFHRFEPTGSDSPHSVRWSADGKELFYDPRSTGFEAVGVTLQPRFAFLKPKALPRKMRLGGTLLRTSYDVVRTTGEFIGVVPFRATPNPQSTTQASNAVSASSPAPEIRVVLNWFEDLKARVR